MCEFNVILNGEIEMKDVIYAKVEENKVIVKDILGKAMAFTDCKIMEVDVPNARLILVRA